MAVIPIHSRGNKESRGSKKKIKAVESTILENVKKFGTYLSMKTPPFCIGHYTLKYKKEQKK